MALDAEALLLQCSADLTPDFAALLKTYPDEDSLNTYVDGIASTVQQKITAYCESTEKLKLKIEVFAASIKKVSGGLTSKTCATNQQRQQAVDKRQEKSISSQNKNTTKSKSSKSGGGRKR